jgi:hypothetical protein
MTDISIRFVEDAADRKTFVDLAYALNKDDPNWVPPLKTEVHGLIDPRTNPWFEHAEARFFLAERGGEPVGRISAQVDTLVQQHMGQGTGQWGMLEAADEEVARALLQRAESWLRGRDMTRALGPFSLSIWDEPGLLIQGHDHPPTVMMGHNKAEYQGWVEAQGYARIHDLYTYVLDVTADFSPLVQRIIRSGENNPRIRVRRVDKNRFEEEARLLLGILNDAWSDNWGYIPLTESEIAYAGKKLKPIVFEDLIRSPRSTGEPVAFMMTLPELNEFTRDLKGRLFPFGWAKCCGGFAAAARRSMRVPLMGVVKRPHRPPAWQAARFMHGRVHPPRWRWASLSGRSARVRVDLDKQWPMVFHWPKRCHARINRVYRIYEKPL